MEPIITVFYDPDLKDPSNLSPWVIRIGNVVHSRYSTLKEAVGVAYGN